MPDGQESGGGMGFQSSSIGADGSYSVNPVIPGTYKLAVIAQDDINGILQGGDEWDAYSPVTEIVTIHAGEKTTQDLKILARWLVRKPIAFCGLPSLARTTPRQTTKTDRPYYRNETHILTLNSRDFSTI